jgi:formyltetrahydrofolate deformylase
VGGADRGRAGPGIVGALSAATTVRLLVICRDRPGIVSAVSGFLADRSANIVDAEQHSTGDRFFLRIEATLADDDPERLRADFAAVAAAFDMEWRLALPDADKPVAILVSRYEHCLVDLLWRFEQGELEGRAALVVSNHPDLAGRAESLGIPFRHIPVTRTTKPEAERELLDALREAGVRLVVLARYMQILSGPFLDALGVPVLNIHHSFLPAFAGPSPYRQAVDRGVKVIGATAHYVTEELDNGPIVEQDVARVTHRETVDDLLRIGRDVERVVLARAVRWHLEDRVLVDGGRTVVFH